MIQIFVNDSELDLLSIDDVPFGVDYAIANAGDISKRTSNLSTEFQVPGTANNKLIFENVDELPNDSTFSKQLLKCRVFVNGVDQKITSCFIRKFTHREGYSIRLFGGNVDFFQSMGESLLSDLDFSEFDHIRNSTNVAANTTNTTGMVYPLIQYGTQPETGNNLYNEPLYPAVWGLDILKRIITSLGYSYSGDLFDDATFAKVLIPFSNQRFRYHPDDLVPENLLIATLGSNQAVSGGATDEINLAETYDPGNNFESTRMTCPTSATFTVTWGGRCNKNPGAAIEPVLQLVREQPDGTISVVDSISFSSTALVLSLIETIDLEFNVDDQIYLRGYGGDLGTTFFTGTLLTGTFLRITDIQDMNPEIEPGWNDKWSVGVNLPDVSQRDFIKWVVFRFGCLINVDELTKNVDITKFGVVKDNKTDPDNSHDWSDKLDLSKKFEIVFSDTYANRNFIRYKEDNTVPTKPDGSDYELIMDNETLEAEKDLYTAPFAASVRTTVLDQKIPTVEILLWQLDSSSEWQSDGAIEPRVVFAQTRSLGTTNLTSDGVVTATVYSWICPWFIDQTKTIKMGFEDNGSTTDMADMLDLVLENRVIKGWLYLTESDINQLDHKKPVWIEYFSSWFYVSLVSKYIPGRAASTFVYLIPV